MLVENMRILATLVESVARDTTMFKNIKVDWKVRDDTSLYELWLTAKTPSDEDVYRLVGYVRIKTGNLIRAHARLRRPNFASEGTCGNVNKGDYANNIIYPGVIV